MDDLTFEEQILLEVDEKGYIVDYNLPKEKSETLIKMRDSGILSSIKSLGIKFINEDYFFTYPDNRFNLKIKKECFGIESLVKS